MPLTPRALAHGRTIDPPDAADLDDAIDVRKHSWGWRVCVSIADVAEHVPAGSQVDQQAYQQGFSHYFADRQDPMLPLEMAEDRLSLLVGQWRDTLTFRLDLGADFAVTALDIQKTRLQSDAQLTYDQVSAVLDAPHHPDYADWRGLSNTTSRPCCSSWRARNSTVSELCDQALRVLSALSPVLAKKPTMRPSGS